jgi:hypothetical protein
MSVSHPRGTTNGNSRGNSEARRLRRAWLIEHWGTGLYVPCFFCGDQLRDGTLTVDRIIPGTLGGAYQFGNIRAACLHCNSIEGSKLRDALRRGVDFFGRSWDDRALHPHVASQGRLLPGQVSTILHLVGDGRMSRARIAREVGCHVDSVTRHATTQH